MSKKVLITCGDFLVTFQFIKPNERKPRQITPKFILVTLKERFPYFNFHCKGWSVDKSTIKSNRKWLICTHMSKYTCVLNAHTWNAHTHIVSVFSFCPLFWNYKKWIYCIVKQYWFAYFSYFLGLYNIYFCESLFLWFLFIYFT